MDFLPTRVGLAGWNDHRHFGYSVFNDLAGEVTTTGLITLASTGKLASREDCAVLDDIAVILTVADPRIYPLKLVRLASSWGSSLAGLSAAVAAMNGAVVGPQISQDAAYWLKEIAEKLGENPVDSPVLEKIVLEQFELRKRVSGFGVPFRNVDERATALTVCAEKRGRDTGRYWNLQKAVAAIVLEHRNLAANVGLPVAGLSLDMGLSPGHLSALYTGLTMNVFIANAVEGADQAPAVLRCLPDSFVEYIGAPPRVYPQD